MKDPRNYLDKDKMSRLQVIVVIITTLLNAIDGFDVLSISFAAPGIAKEWGTTPAALGIVLSMELIGMAIGSFILGGVADRIGRRRTILGCLVVMTAGMLLVTTASNVIQLSIWRVLVGIGIGGILACVNAVVAEFSSIKRRGFCPFPCWRRPGLGEFGRGHRRRNIRLADHPNRAEKTHHRNHAADLDFCRLVWPDLSRS